MDRFELQRERERIMYAARRRQAEASARLLCCALRPLERGLSSLARALVRWLRARRTHRSLERLSPHMLKDIGVEVTSVRDGGGERKVVDARRSGTG